MHMKKQKRRSWIGISTQLTWPGRWGRLERTSCTRTRTGTSPVGGLPSRRATSRKPLWIDRSRTSRWAKQWKIWGRRRPAIEVDTIELATRSCKDEPRVRGGLAEIDAGLWVCSGSETTKRNLHETLKFGISGAPASSACCVYEAREETESNLCFKLPNPDDVADHVRQVLSI